MPKTPIDPHALIDREIAFQTETILPVVNACNELRAAIFRIWQGLPESRPLARRRLENYLETIDRMRSEFIDNSMRSNRRTTDLLTR